MLWEAMNAELRRVLETIYREEQLRRHPPKQEPPLYAEVSERERAYGLYWSCNNSRGWPVVVTRYSLAPDIMQRIHWYEEGESE